MPEPRKIALNSSLVRVGESIFAALTPDEIAQILDFLFTALTPDARQQLLDHLPPDTRQTLEGILTSPVAAGRAEAASTPPVSLAKLAQLWAELWRAWDGVVSEAAQENGTYIVQEAHWEPPYFDSVTFIEDLEHVAAKMLPLLPTAFENSFDPNLGFAEALRDAEEEVSSALPEWIPIVDGLYLGRHLTACVLQWEWLLTLAEDENAFDFAQYIREWESAFSHVHLDSGTVIDFLMQLSEAQQRTLFDGLTAHQASPTWKQPLENLRSPWHAFYMHGIERYAPERYLDHLRPTISQRWQNGLPIIASCIAQENYQDSLTVIEETLAALLHTRPGETSWTPEASLLFSRIGTRYGDADHPESPSVLLQYYQQTARALDQFQRASALELQLIAFDHFCDWQIMFQAFAEITVPEETRQALFQSWQHHLIEQATPSSSNFVYRQTASDIWWLHWLIESIVDSHKGPLWFQQALTQWLTSLPGKRLAVDEDLGYLRLLTKDTMNLDDRRIARYPIFYQVVIAPRELASPDDASRQAYLQQYGPDDLWDQLMTYWQAQLHRWVPDPKLAQQSNYTGHARWMEALRELAPQSYETLLSQWRVDHRRRRNLWQAMDKLGLG